MGPGSRWGCTPRNARLWGQFVTSRRLIGSPGGERYSNGQPSTRCVCLAGLTFEVMVAVVSDHNFKPGCNRVVVGGFRLLMVTGVVIASTTPPGY